MKFKYGDIIYCKNYLLFDIEPYPLQVLSFYNKKKKYLCIDTTEYSPGDNGTALYLIDESNMDYFEKINKDYCEEIKKIYNSLFPENMDIRYFNIYEYTDDGEINLYRKTPLHRKEFYIPTR